MEQFFNPKSIAVIGASDKPGSIGHTLVQNLIDGGFAGTILPVNPNREQVHGLQAYHAITDAPPFTDLAIIAVPIAGVPEVVRQCLRAGSLGVILTASCGRPLGEDGRESLGDTIGDAKARSPFDELNDQQLIEEVAQHINKLGPREQLILKRRFGLDGVDPESLEEVGVRLGVTRERIRQLQNQALATLRQKMLDE